MSANRKQPKRPRRPSAAELLDLALPRTLDLAPDEQIIRELKRHGASAPQARAAIESAHALTARDLDEKDLHRIRQSAFAAASSRLADARRDTERLLRLMVPFLEAAEDEDNDGQERRAAARMVLAIDRQIHNWANIVHRTYRDLIVALVPKEVRHSVEELTDEQLREIALKALR